MSSHRRKRYTTLGPVPSDTFYNKPNTGPSTQMSSSISAPRVPPSTSTPTVTSALAKNHSQTSFQSSRDAMKEIHAQEDARRAEGIRRGRAASSEKVMASSLKSKAQFVVREKGKAKEQVVGRKPMSRRGSVGAQGVRAGSSAPTGSSHASSLRSAGSSKRYSPSPMDTEESDADVVEEALPAMATFGLAIPVPMVGPAPAPAAAPMVKSEPGLLDAIEARESFKRTVNREEDMELNGFWTLGDAYSASAGITRILVKRAEEKLARLRDRLKGWVRDGSAARAKLKVEISMQKDYLKMMRQSAADAITAPRRDARLSPAPEPDPQPPRAVQGPAPLHPVFHSEIALAAAYKDPAVWAGTPRPEKEKLVACLEELKKGITSDLKHHGTATSPKRYASASNRVGLTTKEVNEYLSLQIEIECKMAEWKRDLALSKGSEGPSSQSSTATSTTRISENIPNYTLRMDEEVPLTPAPPPRLPLGAFARPEGHRTMAAYVLGLGPLATNSGSITSGLPGRSAASSTTPSAGSAAGKGKRRRDDAEENHEANIPPHAKRSRLTLRSRDVMDLTVPIALNEGQGISSAEITPESSALTQGFAAPGHLPAKVLLRVFLRGSTQSEESAFGCGHACALLGGPGLSSARIQHVDIERSLGFSLVGPREETFAIAFDGSPEVPVQPKIGETYQTILSSAKDAPGTEGRLIAYKLAEGAERGLVQLSVKPDEQALDHYDTSIALGEALQVAVPEIEEVLHIKERRGMGSDGKSRFGTGEYDAVVRILIGGTGGDRHGARRYALNVGTANIARRLRCDCLIGEHANGGCQLGMELRSVFEWS